MKQIQNMIESSSTKSEAMNMLNTWRIFGNITGKYYSKGRELINKEFKK